MFKIKKETKDFKSGFRLDYSGSAGTELTVPYAKVAGKTPELAQSTFAFMAGKDWAKDCGALISGELRENIKASNCKLIGDRENGYEISFTVPEEVSLSTPVSGQYDDEAAAKKSAATDKDDKPLDWDKDCGKIIAANGGFGKGCIIEKGGHFFAVEVR